METPKRRMIQSARRVTKQRLLVVVVAVANLMVDVARQLQ